MCWSLRSGCHWEKSFGCQGSVLEDHYEKFWLDSLFFLAHEVRGFALPCSPDILGYIIPSLKQWGQLTTDCSCHKCELNSLCLFESRLYPVLYSNRSLSNILTKPPLPFQSGAFIFILLFFIKTMSFLRLCLQLHKRHVTSPSQVGSYLLGSFLEK
jgi:hypothetical protein